MKFLGILFIISGLLTIKTGTLNIALGVSTEVKGIFKYIVSIPEILIGTFMFYYYSFLKDK